MRFLQIAFIAVLGVTSLATYATSQTLHGQCIEVAQVMTPAPLDN